MGMVRAAGTAAKPEHATTLHVTSLGRGPLFRCREYTIDDVVNIGIDSSPRIGRRLIRSPSVWERRRGDPGLGDEVTGRGNLDRSPGLPHDRRHRFSYRRHRFSAHCRWAGRVDAGHRKTLGCGDACRPELLAGRRRSQSVSDHQPLVSTPGGSTPSSRHYRSARLSSLAGSRSRPAAKRGGNVSRRLNHSDRGPCRTG